MAKFLQQVSRLRARAALQDWQLKHTPVGSLLQASQSGLTIRLWLLAVEFCIDAWPLQLSGGLQHPDCKWLAYRISEIKQLVWFRDLSHGWTISECMAMGTQSLEKAKTKTKLIKEAYVWSKSPYGLIHSMLITSYNKKPIKENYGDLFKQTIASSARTVMIYVSKLPFFFLFFGVLRREREGFQTYSA